MTTMAHLTFSTLLGVVTMSVRETLYLYSKHRRQGDSLECVDEE